MEEVSMMLCWNGKVTDADEGGQSLGGTRRPKRVHRQSCACFQFFCSVMLRWRSSNFRWHLFLFSSSCHFSLDLSFHLVFLLLSICMSLVGYNCCCLCIIQACHLCSQVPHPRQVSHINSQSADLWWSSPSSTYRCDCDWQRRWWFISRWSHFWCLSSLLRHFSESAPFVVHSIRSQSPWLACGGLGAAWQTWRMSACIQHGRSSLLSFLAIQVFSLFSLIDHAGLNWVRCRPSLCARFHR